jgi:hypothetical protein
LTIDLSKEIPANSIPMNKIPTLAISALALVSVSFTACETPGQGAKYGAIAGAAVGAIAGGDVRSAAVVGKVRQEERRRQYPGYEEDRAYGAGYAVEYPVARRASRPGHVISPFKPYALVDVRGIRSGARVIDPVSNRVFINP